MDHSEAKELVEEKKSVHHKVKEVIAEGLVAGINFEIY